MRVVISIILLAGAVASILFLPDEAGWLGLTPSETATVAGFGLLALANLVSLAPHYRGRLGAALAGALAWVAIFGAVMVGYVYRSEVMIATGRVMDEIVPGRVVPSGPGEAVAVRRADGHYAFDMLANGVKLRFMFDTGATNVVLRAEDAARMGLDTARLDYRVSVSTANGRALAAPVTIEALSAGNITQRQVRALVAKPGALHENLLGQSFLERLSGYSVDKNRLVLKQ